MQIKLNNFGPIREFSFNIKKDFHLIVGGNNVGKSYAITAVYLILKVFEETLSNPNVLLSICFQENDRTDFVDKIKMNLESCENIDITSDLQEIVVSNLLTTLIVPLTDSLKTSFDSIENLSNQLSKEQFSITISSEEYKLSIVPDGKNLSIGRFEFKNKYFVKKASLNKKNLINNNKVTVYYNQKKTCSAEFSKRCSQLINALSFSLLWEASVYVKNVHYLPASRSGLYQALSAFGQIVAELSKNRSFVTKKIELPGISKPLSDYFLTLSDIKGIRTSKAHQVINSIAEEIEKEILHGKVSFDSKTKRLIFFPDNTELSLDLSSTSSMVSELSPIVSYIRYVLTKTSTNSSHLFKGLGLVSDTSFSDVRRAKHLVMIEEPEAHLHPEIQIKITEFFAKLVQADVKIIMTSHSNFIFNKINNLILEKKIDIEKLSTHVLKNTNMGSVPLNPVTDDLGIDDENFLSAAELLFEEKSNLIQDLNNNDR